MKRIVLVAVAVAALAAVPAEANNGHGHGHHHAQSPDSKGRCGIVKRGFVVTGNNATFSVTQNTDGTYDGTVTLTATSANSHARKSGVNATDSNSETFTLDNTKIVFGPDVTDGPDADTTVGPGDVQPTDTVQLNGKIPYAKKGSSKKPCSDRGYGSDRYGDPKIRQVTVNRQTTAGQAA